MVAKFALLGAAGYIAPRHMKAIHDVGGDLVAACDPYDGVGVLDRHFPDCRFFTEVERFDRHLEKMRRRADQTPVDYVTICTPNYLHDAHCRLALRLHAHAICEKPLVISPWNLDQLAAIESEYGRRVYTVLQLRLHSEAIRLREAIAARGGERVEVNLSYITRRGPWYQRAWKGSDEKSGGVAMNIGIHFFDLLIWLFGPVEQSAVTLREVDRMRGTLTLKGARVNWFLSIRGRDLPPEVQARGQHAYRALTIVDAEFDFSTGFDDLHTRVYQEVLAGRGHGLEDARASIELVHQLRHAPLRTPSTPPTFARRPRPSAGPDEMTS
ncbi:MAG: Gfo/Idh/MocA family oxidoreductase [Myxococcales bacterium]|nr:Gfo/Idh/MocA family oxidoreductase [Myxococcales bacterium]